MALACDIRITAAGGPAGRRRAGRAKLVSMGGARHRAEQALTFGLVDAVVPAGEPMTRADALGANALAADRRHVAAIQKLITASIALD